MATGAIWTWGQNDYGQLGDNSTTNRSSPVSVVHAGPWTEMDFNQQNVAIDTTGSVWCWGRTNDTGALGNNSTANQSSPVSIARAGSYVEIAVGKGNNAWYGFAIDGTDGSLWAWGSGGNGVLGTGNTDAVSSPVSVLGARSYVEVAGGAESNFAIDGTDGSLWSWGSGSNGALGTGNTDAVSSPVSVLGARSYIKVSAYDQFAVALNGADNTLWAWGLNDNGQLGTNNTTNISSPVSVVQGSKRWTDISVGDSFSLAIDMQGMVWSWGRNNRGQLGDGTTVSKSSPVSIARSASYVQVIAGYEHAIALEHDGTVWSWGFNNSGALGNNSTENQSSPVSIAKVGPYNFIAAGYHFSGAIEGTFATAPSIDTQPQAQNKRPGQDVTFTVVASGTAPLSYQWKKGGSDISGATASSLTLTDLEEADQGYYSVSVTNVAGSVLSNSVFLSIAFDPGPGGNASPRDRVNQPTARVAVVGALRRFFRGLLIFR